MGLPMGLPLLWAVQLALDAQPEVETQVRKLEELLRLEKEMWLFTTLLDSGLAHKVGEENTKLETLACNFAKQEGHKLLWIKILALVTKPDLDNKR